MYTLSQIRDQVIREDSGGIFTDETRLDYRYIDSLIHQYRGDAIFTYYGKVKRINSIWTQRFNLQYEAQLQDSVSCVKFRCPPFISVDALRDGLFYIGATEGNCAYRKLTHRSELANNNQHRYTRLKPTEVKVIYSDGFIEAYGNTMIKEMRVDGIAMNPEDCPTYNKEIDLYPICAETLTLLKQLMFQKEGSLIARQPADVKSDSQDTANINNRA